MAENGQPTNSGEASSEDEILVIPAGTQGSTTTGSGRVATSVEEDPNEIPDPPPEED